MHFCKNFVNFLNNRNGFYLFVQKQNYSKISSRNPDVVRYVKKQLNDEYSKWARMHNYRARSAFKLKEMNERFKIVKKGDFVLDIGAAPGSWSQVLSGIIFDENLSNNYIGSGYILGVDLQIISPVKNVDFLSQADITKQTTQAEIRRRLNGREFNAILSDMAPSPCGDGPTDHKRIIELCESVLNLIYNQNPSENLPLIKNGKFLCKIWDGIYKNDLIEKMRKEFKNVRTIKPDASRANSAESYLYASGFRI